jgi:hypothetical protein
VALSPAVLLSLQQSVGNCAVSRLLSEREAGFPVQRYPVPTAGGLKADAGYKGGKISRRWKALRGVLDAYHERPTLDGLKKVMSAAQAARDTFDDEKKQKRVGGADRAKAIQAALDRLVADCHIQAMRLDMEHHMASSQPFDWMIDEVADAAGRTRTRLRETTDATGELAHFLNGAEAWVDKGRRALQAQGLDQHKFVIQNYLRSNNYEASSNAGFWHPRDPALAYRLSHVGWKAHLGATFTTWRQVLDRALPVLMRHGVNHKVDTDPKVFEGTNKFVTIYPPSPKRGGDRAWAPLIKDLEDAVGGNVVVVGEIPVGQTGVVGMRYGQLTPLTEAMLADMGLKLEGSGMPYSHRHPEFVTLYPKRVAAAREGVTPPPIDNSVLPGSELCLTKKKVLFFSVRADERKYGAAILYQGSIRPDLRAEANPFDAPYPPGVMKKA